METVITNSTEETEKLAEVLLKKLPHNLVFLKGDLGAGKTAFVRGLGKALKIKRITSPTYTIARSHSLDHQFKTDHLSFNRFEHIDLYRLKNSQETDVLGLVELIKDKNNLVVIEWPELIEKDLPFPRTEITFKVLDENRREISIK